MEKPEVKEIQWIPTGCDLLDCVLGGGSGLGIPAGKIINIVGDTGSGKTFLACEIIAAAYRLYGKKVKWNYDDAESGFTFNTEKIYGIDIPNPEGWETYQSHTVEQMEYHYKKFLNQVKSDEIGIYVVDSLDGLSSEENEKRGVERFKAFENDKKFEQGSYQMGTPKFLSQEFFKRMTDLTHKRNTLLIIVSQVRDNIDPFSFKKYVRSGGKALDFYAYGSLWLAYVRDEEKKGLTIGSYVKARTEKLKAPRPFRECFFTFLFEYGLDNIGSNVDFVFGYRTEKGEVRNAVTAAWKETEGRVQSLNEIKKFLKEQECWEQFSEEVGTKPKLVDCMEWINARPPLVKAFAEVFGEQFTREEMIRYVEENNLQEELSYRAKAQWEEIEEAVKLQRRPKYAD